MGNGVIPGGMIYTNIVLLAEGSAKQTVNVPMPGETINFAWKDVNPHVKIGTDAYLKGANKLKNLTINSSPEEPTQIGEGVELVNGIVGLGRSAKPGAVTDRHYLADGIRRAGPGGEQLDRHQRHADDRRMVAHQQRLALQHGQSQ